jgi:hypothetical protein
MIKTVAINGSPRMEKGYTAMILNPFLEGMMDAGSETELFYAKRLAIKSCSYQLVDGGRRRTSEQWYALSKILPKQ